MEEWKPTLEVGKEGTDRVDSAVQAFAALDENGYVVFASTGFVELSGIALGDLIGKMLPGWQPTSDELFVGIAKASNKRTRTGYEVFVNPQGADEQSQTAAFEAEFRFRQMMEQSPLSVHILASDGSTIAVNHAFERLWGVGIEGLGDYNILQDPQLDESGVKPLLIEAFSGHSVQIPTTRYQMRHGPFAGQLRWVRAIAYPLVEEGNVKEVVFIHEDITEQWQTEMALRASEERYRSLVTATAAVVWHTQTACEFDEDQPSWRAYTGQSFEEIAGNGWLDAVHPDDRQKTIDGWAQARDVFETEHRLRRADGVYRVMLVRAVPIFNLDGTICEWIGAHTDTHERVQAESLLHERTALLEALSLGTVDGLFIKDLEGRYIFINPVAASVFGKTPEEVVGQRDQDLFTEEAWPKVREADEVVIRERRTMQSEVVFPTSSGPRTWRSTKKPYLDEAGNVLGVIGVTQDVTELKESQEEREHLIRQLEVERAQLQSLFMQAPAYIAAAYGPDHILEVANRQFQRLYGYRPMLGKPVRETMPEAIEQGFIDRLDKVYDSGIPYVGREIPFTPPGETEPRFFDYIFQPMREPDGSITGVFLHGVDVTEQVHARKRIEQLNAELEERVQARTKELIEANEEMEGFNYSVSHDLRSPLRAISATSRILQEEYGDLLPEEAHDQLNRQIAASRRLGRLIDDLLMLSRIARQELRRQPVDISALAIEVFDEISHPANVSFRVEPGVSAYGDPVLLRFLLQNLFENAVKFSPKGGEVRFYQKHGAYVVEDDGIGFEMQYASRIFRPFERLHRSDQIPGTGIGLANVERIVRRHGGRIWAESELGKGARFFFTLG